MDARKELVSGSNLDFPGMYCTVEKEIGRGSNAIVYQGSYPDLLNRDEKHIVLIKELFPFHPKAAIYRNELDEIVCAPEGEAVYSVHRQSFEYGNKIHLKMLAKHPELTGANINTFSCNQTNYSVLGYTGGRSLEAELAGAAGDLKQLTVRMLGLLDSLEAFHESGFLHLDIAPDNILLIGQGTKERVMLIDYNSVYDMNQSQQDTAPYYSIKQGYTAPEIRSGKLQAICPASDIYSAAAVFYRCLSGAPLTSFQMIRPTPPDVAGCRCLEDMPDTVVSMVKQILYTGLQNLPHRRYQNTEDMRKAFRELLDRIEGVGITHWALWEAGKKTVQNIIHNNPSFSYLTDTDSLFPANVRIAEGESAGMDEYMGEMLKESGSHTILVAPGGMGKTTALLRTMTEQSSRYSPTRPAIAYVSLYGWQEGGTTYIRNRILENLHFTEETASFDSARQMLHHVMNTPLQTKEGKMPSLLLFLDGFNEASGSTQALTDEILSLASLEGVRLFLTNRTEMPHLPFRHISLMPLSEENVSDILYAHKLLMPESEAVRALLQTPLMLSIFIRSAEAEQKQIMAATQEELLDAYFHSLRHKAFSDLPEDAEERWQIDAALDFVLPSIAGRMAKKNGAVRDAELLNTVAYCYKLFSKPLLRRAFPQWIGHSKAIRGDSQTAEEWYGLIVHDILWKRLGLLVRNDRDEYQIIHQIIGEYLAEKDRINNRQIWRKQRIKLGILAAVLAVLLAGGMVFYTEVIAPPQYQEMLADRVMSYGMSAYQAYDDQYTQLADLIECARTAPENYAEQLNWYTNSVYRKYPDTDTVFLTLETMLADGEVMPWSGDPLETESYKEFISRANRYGNEYERLVAALNYVMEDEKAYGRFGEKYIACFSELLDTDAEIIALLFQVSCRSHLLERYDDGTVEAKTYKDTMKSHEKLNRYFIEDASAKELTARLYEVLYHTRDELLAEITATGIFSMMERAAD